MTPACTSFLHERPQGGSAWSPRSASQAGRGRRVSRAGVQRQAAAARSEGGSARVVGDLAVDPGAALEATGELLRGARSNAAPARGECARSAQREHWRSRGACCCATPDLEHRMCKLEGDNRAGFRSPIFVQGHPKPHDPAVTYIRHALLHCGARGGPGAHGALERRGRANERDEGKLPGQERDVSGVWWPRRAATRQQACTPHARPPDSPRVTPAVAADALGPRPHHGCCDSRFTSVCRVQMGGGHCGVGG